MQYAHENYRTYTAELHYSDDGEAWTYVDVADLQGEGVDEPHWEVVPSVEKLGSMLDLFYGTVFFAKPQLELALVRTHMCLTWGTLTSPALHQLLAAAF